MVSANDNKLAESRPRTTSEDGKVASGVIVRPLWKRVLWPYCFAVVISVLILTGLYRLNRIDLTVPLNNTGDALFYQALFKNFVETGHYNINSQLGAPGQLELYDFPVPHSTHLIGFAILRLFTHNFGLAFNLYYLATYPAAAVLGLYVFRRFKMSTGLSVALSVLYAFLPFHLLRSQSHYVHSSYYLVPLAVMVSLWVSTGTPLFTFNKARITKPTREGVLALLICILIAGDNPYWVFFSGIFIVVGGLLGQCRYHHPHTLASTAILSFLLAFAFIVNLSPNLIYFHQRGTNPIAARAPSDAEIYGLKIVQMVAPVTGHRIPWLAQWKERYNKQAPLVNENDTATLGAIGTIGFFALLGVFFSARSSPLLYSLATLNLSSVLLATIGGLSSLFAFAVWSQFRGYNRISVFIGFLCLFAIGILLDAAIYKFAVGRKSASLLIALLVMLLGLADQIPRHFIPPRSPVEEQVRSRRGYFARLQASVPSGSMIFQLPYIPFPQSTSPNQLGIYEELIPYLSTDSLHWSHGSMRGRDADQWNAQVGSEPIPQLVNTVAAAGFAGLLIDRFGYNDRAASLEAQMKQLTGEAPRVSSDERYAFFSLASVASNLKSHYDTKALDELSHPVIADMETGCWPLEINASQSWNWCDMRGELVISNSSAENREVEVEMTLRTNTIGPSDVRIEGNGTSWTVQANTVGGTWKAKLKVPPGKSIYVLRSDGPAANAPGDPRHLIFMVQDLKVSEQTAR
jgi:hypothetical protein